MQTVTTIVELPKQKRNTKRPADPDFFGPPEKKKPSKPRTSGPKLRDLFPEDLSSYWNTFLKFADRRAYNTRLGYWEGENEARDWRAVLMKHRKPGQQPYVMATRNNILGEVERHLDAEFWRARGHRAKGWRQPFWAGTLGGVKTRWSHYDLDNHGGERLRYVKDGASLIVPDLSPDFMKLVARVLSLHYEEYGVRPTHLTTSSDSLGLYLWFVRQEPEGTQLAFNRLRRLADDGGMPNLEVYPGPPIEDDPNPYGGRCISRLPCGQGSVMLTADGIIRGWRDQLVNFTSSTPASLPSLPILAKQLLQLWLELHQRWRLDFLDVPSGRLDHHSDVVSQIRAWVQDGCPCDRIEQVVQVQERYGKKSSTPCSDVSSPEGWERMTHPARLYRIATAGCPAEGWLNRCIIMLVRHLMQYELDDLDNDEKEEVAFAILERWCLSKHNGCSGRLSQGDTVLPKDVESVIWRDIRFVSCDIRQVGVKNTLRVRHLITGEGPPNVFAPRAKSGGETRDLLSVYTFEDPQIRADDYQQAHQRTIETIRSGIYDHETIEGVEDKIKLDRPAFQSFARRLTNFLLTNPNQTAHIHTDYFMAMADTTSPTTMTKYKVAAKSKEILKVVSHDFRKGGESKSYKLHPAVLSPLGHPGTQTANSVSAMMNVRSVSNLK